MLNKFSVLLLPQRPVQRQSMPVKPAAHFAAAPDRVTFGKTPDAQANALLAKVLGQMDQVTDWDQRDIPDKWGHRVKGTDLKFTMKGANYTLRDVFDDGAFGDLQLGTSLIVKDSAGSKTYKIQGQTYERYYEPFSKRADDQFIQDATARLRANAPTLTDVMLFEGGTVFFKAGDRRYELRPNDKNQGLNLLEFEPPPASDDLIHQYHAASTVPFDQFKADYLRFRLPRRIVDLDAAQADQVRGLIKGPVASDLQNRYGLGPNLDVSPVLLKMARAFVQPDSGEHISSHHSQPGKSPAFEEAIWYANGPGSWWYVVSRREGHYSLKVQTSDLSLPHSTTVPVTDPRDQALAKALIKHGLAESRARSERTITKALAYGAQPNQLKAQEASVSQTKQVVAQTRGALARLLETTATA